MKQESKNNGNGSGKYSVISGCPRCGGALHVRMEYIGVVMEVIKCFQCGEMYQETTEHVPGNGNGKAFHFKKFFPHHNGKTKPISNLIKLKASPFKSTFNSIL